MHAQERAAREEVELAVENSANTLLDNTPPPRPVDRVPGGATTTTTTTASAAQLTVNPLRPTKPSSAHDSVAGEGGSQVVSQAVAGMNAGARPESGAGGARTGTPPGSAAASDISFPSIAHGAGGDGMAGAGHDEHAPQATSGGVVEGGGEDLELMPTPRIAASAQHTEGRDGEAEGAEGEGSAPKNEGVPTPSAPTTAGTGAGKEWGPKPLSSKRPTQGGSGGEEQARQAAELASALVKIHNQAQTLMWQRGLLAEGEPLPQSKVCVCVCARVRVRVCVCV